MLNKNLIVGLVAIVLLGGGAIFYFFGGNEVLNLPIAKKGELTREVAREIILKQFKEHPNPLVSGMLSGADITVTGISMQSETKAMVNVTTKIEVGGASSEMPQTLTFYLYDDGWKVEGF